MNKSGMKRMAKYMLIFSERIMLLYLIVIIFWSVYMVVISGDFHPARVDSVLGNLPFYFMLLGALITWIVAMGYVPLLHGGHMSMGATRKEFAFGITITFLSIDLQVAILGSIVYQVFKSLDFYQPSFMLVFNNVGAYFASILGLVLFTSGFGLILAFLVQRFGRVAYYIFVAVIAILAGFAGAFSVFLLEDTSFGLALTKLPIILPIVGALVYILGVAVYRLATRRIALTV